MAHGPPSVELPEGRTETCGVAIDRGKLDGRGRTPSISGRTEAFRVGFEVPVRRRFPSPHANIREHATHDSLRSEGIRRGVRE